MPQRALTFISWAVVALAFVQRKWSTVAHNAGTKELVATHSAKTATCELYNEINYPSAGATIQRWNLVVPYGQWPVAVPWPLILSFVSWKLVEIRVDMES